MNTKINFCPTLEILMLELDKYVLGYIKESSSPSLDVIFFEKNVALDDQHFFVFICGLLFQED